MDEYGFTVKHSADSPYGAAGRCAGCGVAASAIAVSTCSRHLTCLFRYMTHVRDLWRIFLNKPPYVLETTSEIKPRFLYFYSKPVLTTSKFHFILFLTSVFLFLLIGIPIFGPFALLFTWVLDREWSSNQHVDIICKT